MKCDNSGIRIPFFYYWKSLFLLALASHLFSLSCAQQTEQFFKEEPKDSTALKQESFLGIGPVPYNLPPKKTKKQLLKEQYIEKRKESTILKQIIREEQFIESLKPSGYTKPIPESYTFYLKGVEGETNEEKLMLASVKFYLEIENYEFSSNMQTQLGIYYSLRKRYDRSLQVFKSALMVKESLKDQHGQETILKNLASIYRFLDNKEEAKKYYSQLFSKAIKLQDLNEQAASLEQLALLKARESQYAEAQTDIIKRVLPLYKKANNSSGRIRAYNSLAAIYQDQEKFTQSRWFYLQAIEIAAASSEYSGMAHSLYSLGKIKAKIEEYGLAIADYKAAEAYAEESNDSRLLLQIQDEIGDLYFITGDYEAATTAITRYNDLKNKFYTTLQVKNHALKLQKMSALGANIR